MHLRPAANLLLALAASGALAHPADSRAARREESSTTGMRVHVVRLRAGEDLLKEINAYVQSRRIRAGIILTTVGSLTKTTLRLADRNEATTRTGKVEIVSLAGTVEPGGGHLHLSVSGGDGATFGGHLLEGCIVYTTAEIAIGELSGLRFRREPDKASGYDELKIDGGR